MSNSAGIYNFTIEQGTTVRFELEYLDSEEVPVNLSGSHARMQIRPDYADFAEDELFVDISSSVDTEDGTGIYYGGLDESLPPESGTLGIFIAPSRTETFNFDEGLYDLEIYRTGPIGKSITRLLQGRVRISREVTR